MAMETTKSTKELEVEPNEMTRTVDDVKMEYRLKYENMLNIYMQLQSEMVESQKIAETHIKAQKEMIEELKKNVFDKEMKIYNLTEDNDKLKLRNEELEEMNKELESKGSNSKLGDSKTDLSFIQRNIRKSIVGSPIILSDLQKVDLLSPLFMPETPRRVSKVRRISRMHATIRDATPLNDEDKETFYKRIIMTQKEGLDFYATLTGFSIWKEELSEEENGGENAVDLFKMKPCDGKYKDVEIQFLIDYEEDEIEYHPMGFPDKEENESFPSFLRDKFYLGTEMSPRLLEALIAATQT